jgi:hypothetical protein
MSPRANFQFVFFGILAVLASALFTFIFWRSKVAAGEVTETPQPYTLQQLVDRGPDGNPHVSISGFAYSQEYLFVKPNANSKIYSRVWQPVFPSGSGGQPGSIPVLLKIMSVNNPEDMARFASRSTVKGLIINGKTSLDAKERGMLSGRWPNTNFDKVILIEVDREPGKSWATAWMIIALGFFGLGGLLFAIPLFALVLGGGRSSARARPRPAPRGETDTVQILVAGGAIGCVVIFLGMAAVGGVVWALWPKSESAPAGEAAVMPGPGAKAPLQEVKPGGGQPGPDKGPKQDLPQNKGDNNPPPKKGDNNDPPKKQDEIPPKKKEEVPPKKKEEPPFKLRDVKLPAPAVVGQTVAVGPYKIKELNVTLINLPVEQDAIVQDILWTPEGDAFFTLTRDGKLSRVALKGLVLEKQVELGRKCSGLALSAEGLLANVAGAAEVWLIDPLTLSVNKQWPARDVERVVAAPSSRLGFFLDHGKVVVVDLTKGIAVRQIKADTAHARVTPDGKLFITRDFERLRSFVIKGVDLVPYQASEGIVTNPSSICISPDSQYVSIPCGAGNHGTKYGTYIYSTGALQKPLVLLNSGAYPRVMAFDPPSGLIFAQRIDMQLLVYAANGNLLKEYHLTTDQNHHEDPRQFVVHPQGKQMLLLGETRLMLVDYAALAAGG